MITCIITYDIAPFREEAFARYARTWGQTIPQCGAELFGYFAPAEGSETTAYGIYSLPDLAAYEAYRARLAAHPEGRRNYDFAAAEGFIRREDRLFLKQVSGPHAERVDFG